MNLTFCCSPENDLYSLLQTLGHACPRFSDPRDAVDGAPPGSAVLVLAEGYPDSATLLGRDFYDRAAAKGLRLFVEYPSFVPDMTLGASRTVTWERAVVATDRFEPSLAQHQILVVQDCRFLPTCVSDPLVVAARVAGFDRAIYGLPKETFPILFQAPGSNILVATTQLSRFITGRYAPSYAWKHLWESILGMLDPTASAISLDWVPDVRPSFAPGTPLPEDHETRTLTRAVRWIFDSGLLIAPSTMPEVERLLHAGEEITINENPPVGDGSLGILEGYASGIRYDGKQVLKRLPVRADCNTTSAMILAIDGLLMDNSKEMAVARNLLDFVYFTSDMHAGVRGDPEHPAFGHLAWGSFAHNWQVANYSIDNSCALLSTLLAAAALKTDRYDQAMMKILLANLRTTGTLGFRGERIDNPDLEKNGWRHYAESEIRQPLSQCESHLWAAYLWAYRHTNYRPFLETAKKAIQITIEDKGESRTWTDTAELVRMLLPLAWLVRLEDTPLHRHWLKIVADDVLDRQDSCGAIQERSRDKRFYNYGPADSNESYGSGETTIIQRIGDPATDQLYMSGYALMGLREAWTATGDARLRQAEDKLTQFVCRIQIDSPKHANLDGWWFRAFDYRNWEYWGASGDTGWGAWCLETGWGAGWTCAVLGLRRLNTSLWDYTAASRIGEQLDAVQRLMAKNDGGPWKGISCSNVRP